MKSWYCIRCKSLVDYENKRCNCTESPSPWQDISAEDAALIKSIDERDYKSLLSEWRFSAVGNPIFQGLIGEHFSKRMFSLRDADPEEAILVSKRIGWK